jgi:hypothetical protein
MAKRPFRARFAAGVVAFSLVATLLTVLAPQSTETAEAADLSSFDPSMIITDAVFTNSGSMTEGAIQSFLESKNVGCSDYTSGSTKYVCIKNYSTKYSSRAANSNCSAMSSSSSAKASTIIYRVARACGINPQVLIVLVQKEQGLLSGARSPVSYKWATGYACPDTSACDTKYSGFFNQIWNAAWQFKQWMNPLSRQYMPNKNNTIKYHPNSSCGTTTVYIKNLATAALYTYTPYVPNKAALSAGYGLGDSCSSYGNRNFFNYFSDWFGSPGNLLKNASFSSNTSYWKSGPTGTISKTTVTDSSKAESGSRFVVVSAAAAGRRLEQDVKKKSYVGDLFTAGAWVRADADDATVEGFVKLQARGGTAESTYVPFTANGTWQYVPVNLAISKTGHTVLRFDVELSTKNTALRVDTTSVYLDAKVTPRATMKVDEQHTNSSGYGAWKRSSTSTVKVSRTKGPPTVGTYNGTLTISKAGAYIAQYVKYTARRGTSYTYGVWLRSASAGSTYSGRLAVSGVGGTTEKVFTPFTVGDTWEFHSVTIDMANTSHNRIGVYIYPDTVGGKLYFDQPELSTNVVTPDATFDIDGSALSTPPATTIVSVVQGDETIGAAVDGTGFLHVTNTTADDSDVHFQITRRLGVGEKYRFEVWVKSATPGTPYDGAVVLEGRTGTTGYELTEQSFTATDEWTRVYIDYTVGVANLTRLRASVRLDSPGADIYVDAAKLN